MSGSPDDSDEWSALEPSEWRSREGDESDPATRDRTGRRGFPWIDWWRREPLPPPEPDLVLDPDNGIARGAEVIGWALARFEYWLSRSGWLRAWLRLALLLTIVLAAVGGFLFPAALGVLAGLAESLHWLVTIVVSISQAVASLPPLVISVGFLYVTFVLGRHLQQRRRQRGREPYAEDRYFP